MDSSELTKNEVRVEIRPIGVKYRCEFCHEGFMEAIHEDSEIIEIIATNPPQYKTPPLRTHLCDKCGKMMKLPRTYPRIDWEEVKNEDGSNKILMDNEEFTS